MHVQGDLHNRSQTENLPHNYLHDDIQLYRSPTDSCVSALSFLNYGKKELLAYFNVGLLFQYLPGETKETHDKIK
jgi:hypothetical protein